MGLNVVFFVFSKAMETIQLERFDEFGYTYIAPRWVIPTPWQKPLSLHRSKQGAETETDQYCFFREYCKELKLSLNNTQFLLDFSQYIDRNTPDACESCIFFTVVSLDTASAPVVMSACCTVCILLIPLTHTMSPKSIYSGLHCNVCSNESGSLFVCMHAW